MATTKNPAVLWNVEQVLTSAEQTQARENIGFPTATASGQVLVYGTSTTIEWGNFLVKNVGTPTWNDLNRSGFYNIANSQTAGTDNSPENGAVSLLAGSTGGDPGQFTTQFVMGSDLFYRTKPSNGSWEQWRELVTQYKDTVTTPIYGYKLVTTNVSSTVGDRTHYSALINITPTGTGSSTTEPYLAFLEIYQVKESDKDRCDIKLKMLNTPEVDDYGAGSPFVIRGSNKGSANGNYVHDWYIARLNSNDTLSDVTVTVTPLLCNGNVSFKGLEPCSSKPALDAYIEYTHATPSITRLISGRTNSAFDSDSGWPLYMDGSGILRPCSKTALRKTVNSYSIGTSSTPVYINGNGEPTPCDIVVGTTNTRTINNHMYTAIEVGRDWAGNAGGATIGPQALALFDLTFPNDYVPSGGSYPGTNPWPAGIMILVSASVYVMNSTADDITISVAQDSTILSTQQFNMPSYTYANYLSATFFAITSAPIYRNTKIKLLVDTLAGNATVGAYTYTVRALI